jgi:N-formylglutamate amidohydrolase
VRPPRAIVHVPHAATEIPGDVAARLLLAGPELDRELLAMTDRYTDELFGLPHQLATVIVYPVSRLVVDPERFEVDSQEPMARRGMGVVYTSASDGRQLRVPPSPAEREMLLERFYRPHHRRLADAVNAALAAHGRCLVLDGHSFPSRALPYEDDQRPDRPEICIGTDPFHTPEWLRRAAVDGFEREGFGIAVDRPFTGAIVPAEHFRKTLSVRSVMVEVKRALYMDEGTGDRRTNFHGLRDRLQRGLRWLIAEEAAREGGGS